MISIQKISSGHIKLNYCNYCDFNLNFNTIRVMVEFILTYLLICGTNVFFIYKLAISFPVIFFVINVLGWYHATLFLSPIRSTSISWIKRNRNNFSGNIFLQNCINSLHAFLFISIFLFTSISFVAIDAPTLGFMPRLVYTQINNVKTLFATLIHDFFRLKNNCSFLKILFNLMQTYMEILISQCILFEKNKCSTRTSCNTDYQHLYHMENSLNNFLKIVILLVALTTL